MEFKTPEVPAWIKGLRAPGYTNVFDLGLGNRNLFGTESMCGDWDGDLLVVAQDFAPADKVREAKDRCDSNERHRAYRHSDGHGLYGSSGLRTNEAVQKFLCSCGYDVNLDGERNHDCGVLYVSASFLLKNGDHWGSALPDWSRRFRAYEDSARVANFVLENMINLKAVVAFGGPAIQLYSYVLGVLGTFRKLPLRSEQAYAGLTKDRRSVLLFSLGHPSRLSNSVSKKVANEITKITGR